MRSPRRVGIQSGTGMVEMLLALPVLLLLGLGIAQFTLVYQAKHALDYALAQAARQGAVEHASAESIERGLAAGLVPYLYGAGSWDQLLQAEARALAHVRSGVAGGWIQLRQRSPTRESFEDWGEQALDAMGEPIAGLVEIANDNLDSRRLRMQPASGTAGRRSAEAIGNRSAQTLADANILRLELVYGVRLVVPVAGTVVIRTLARWHGCPPATGEPPRDERLGLLRLGEGGPLPGQQAWMCAFLGARDGSGRMAGRIPVRASATMRMMSPPRLSRLTGARVDVPQEASAAPEGLAPDPSAGLAPMTPMTPMTPMMPAVPAVPITPMPPRATSPDSPLVHDHQSASAGSTLDNGFLAIGSDRAYPWPANPPADHPALCDG